MKLKVGFIREGNNARCENYAVTAKHSVSTIGVEQLKQGVSQGLVRERFLSPAEIRIPTRESGNAAVCFTDEGCDYNGDTSAISWCVEKMTNAGLTGTEISFRQVQPGFQCQVGQRVAIAVYSEVGATLDSAAAPPGVDLERVYGKHFHKITLTGTVTRVDGDSLFYDINAFGGCAGAVVSCWATISPNLFVLKTAALLLRCILAIFHRSRLTSTRDSCCRHALDRPLGVPRTALSRSRSQEQLQHQHDAMVVDPRRLLEALGSLRRIPKARNQ